MNEHAARNRIASDLRDLLEKLEREVWLRDDPSANIIFFAASGIQRYQAELHSLGSPEPLDARLDEAWRSARAYAALLELTTKAPALRAVQETIRQYAREAGLYALGALNAWRLPSSQHALTPEEVPHGT